MKTQRRQSKRAARRGLTLYEVVLAIGIFLMGMAVVSQLVTIGTQASQHARLNTQAAMHAESLMAEVVSGAREMTDVTDQPIIEGDSNWVWTLKATGGSAAEAGNEDEQSKLKDLTITVKYVGNAAQPLATFTLRRLVRDPEMYVQAAAEEADLAADDKQSGTTTGSGQR